MEKNYDAHFDSAAYEHAKLRQKHANNRKNTKHINKKRKIEATTTSIAYYIKDEKRIGHKKIIIVPEHQEFIETYHKVYAGCWHDNETNTDHPYYETIVRKKLVTIPEQIKKRRCYGEWVPITPYVKRYHNSCWKKDLKNQTNRKIRRHFNNIQSDDTDMSVSENYKKRFGDRWWYD